MLTLALALVSLRQSSVPGVQSFGDGAQVRAVAVGDFVHRSSKLWDAAGRPIPPARAKQLLGTLKGQTFLGFDAEALRRPSDTGVFVFVDVEMPKNWKFNFDMRNNQCLGAKESSKSSQRIYFFSVPKGQSFADLPLGVLTPKAKKVFDFTDQATSQVGEVKLEVDFHQEDLESLTQTSETRVPVTQYTVRAEMPKARFSQYLDVVAPDVLPTPEPSAKSKDRGLDEMLSNLQYEHGLEDMKDLGDGRIQATFAVKVPGARRAGTRLRMVKEDFRLGSIRIAVKPVR